MGVIKPKSSSVSISIKLKLLRVRKFIVFICATLYITYPGNLPHQKKDNNQESNRCITTNDSGDPTEVKLSDGSVVNLYANSVLTEVTTGSDDSIHVKLKGEAYFTITKKHFGQKFVVESEDQIINVVGTHFKVNTNENFSSTTTIEGKVELLIGETKTILKAGEKSKYDKLNGLSVKRFALEEESNKWLIEDFRFRDLPLKEITNRLNAWYDVTILTKGPIDHTHFTLNFTKRDLLISILNRLEATKHLTYAPHNKDFSPGDTILLTAR